MTVTPMTVTPAAATRHEPCALHRSPRSLPAVGLATALTCRSRRVASVGLCQMRFLSGRRWLSGSAGPQEVADRDRSWVPELGPVRARVGAVDVEVDALVHRIDGVGDWL